jgi:hypothetical protein
MVREICETLESLTAQDPLVLILEDLHWVDPSTLDFISALARRRGPAKLLLLGTYRPADVIISGSPLKPLKQDLVLHNLSHEIALERLEESDVAEYIAIKFVEGARESIQQALAIVDRFEVLVAAWQVYATAWQVFQHLKEHKTAETNRERAETRILKIANSFAPDEPLRTTFLAAAPVRRIQRETVVNRTTRQRYRIAPNSPRSRFS